MAFAPETDQKQDFPPAALTALKGSGFPFQTLLLKSSVQQGVQYMRLSMHGAASMERAAFSI
jgi:hypothetical protein